MDFERDEQIEKTQNQINEILQEWGNQMDKRLRNIL